MAVVRSQEPGHRDRKYDFILNSVFRLLASLFVDMKHYLKIVVAMLIWSTWGMMIRWLGLPPVIVLFYTSLIASATVPTVLMLRGELDLSGVLGTWNLFLILSMSSIVNNLTYFYALGHTTVSNAVFTHYTAPIFVALLAPVLIAERLQKITLISLPVAVAGMMLLLFSGGGLDLRGAHMPGIVAGTASGVAYALLIITSRKLSQMRMHHKAIVVILWITTAALAPAALTVHVRITASMFGLLIVTGLIHSTLAPLLYYSALRHVLAQHAAILGYIEPLSAVPLAFVFLSEYPSTLSLFGGILIILSGYLVVYQASQSRPK